MDQWDDRRLRLSARLITGFKHWNTVLNKRLNGETLVELDRTKKNLLPLLATQHLFSWCFYIIEDASFCVKTQ